MLEQNPEIKRYKRNLKKEKDAEWKAWAERALKYINDTMENVLPQTADGPGDRPKDPPRFP